MKGISHWESEGANNPEIIHKWKCLREIVSSSAQLCKSLERRHAQARKEDRVLMGEFRAVKKYLHSNCFYIFASIKNVIREVAVSYQILIYTGSIYCAYSKQSCILQSDTFCWSCFSPRLLHKLYFLHYKTLKSLQIMTVSTLD